MESTKKEKRLLKKAYKKAKRKAIRPWRFFSWLFLVLTVVLVAVSVVVGMFDNTIALLVKGNTFWQLENKDANAVYFEGKFDSQEERLEAGQQLCYQVEAEGAALLLNNGALPLASGAKVSTLSVNSVDLTYGGTGSGNVDASKADNLKAALEKSGLTVNETLWNWYSSEEAAVLMSELGATGAGESAVLAGQAPILEIDHEKYPEDIKKSVSEYSEALILTFSRVGGEGYDCSFPGYEGNDDAINYLELNENERKLLAYAEEVKAATGAKIIVLINTSNALQVDFLNDYDVDACMWVGGLGIAGTNAVTDIIAGKVNPSGSLVDTYCYDNFSSPAMQNFIAQTYVGFDAANPQVPANASTYMVYQEGIYVGYKYYETRYEDVVMGKANVGSFDYAAQVAFPFGYGLSYTSFSYNDMAVSYNEETDQYDITVTVQNDGDVAGKETVQIYAQSPYTQYDIDNQIEKSAVQLIGFGKTDVIAAGESETITINVDRRDLASYDAKGHGTYIIEEGDYFFTAATDSHNAVNNILAAKGYTVADGMDAEGNAALVYGWTEEELDLSYSTSLNGTKIENQLQDADPNEYFGEDTVKFLSRNDWAGTWPTESVKLDLIDSMVTELTEGRWATMGEDYFEVPEEWKEMPVLDAKNGLTLYDMFDMDEDKDGVKAAKDYDDPAWAKLLENVTIDELISIGDCFHWRHSVPSVNAPGSRDENGPQGLTVSLFGGGLVTMEGESAEATAFTSEDVMAATFNLDLIYQVGEMIANDCLDASVSCLYGPGANTHRTPYGGRNFEYYSEDGFLAGEMAGVEVGALLDNGVDVVLKHFALNDCEQDRLGQAAWLTEQAAREIYLKAFQKALEENGGRGGVMTSYTRWGTTWSGMHQNLMTNIMRGEWGNNSMHITDNILVSYCNGADAVLAGGVTCFDAMLPYAVNALTAAKDDPVIVNAMVEAMHHDLFTIINSAAMNGVGPETTVKAIAPKLLSTIRTAATVVAVLFVASLALWIVTGLKFKKSEAYKTYKEAKKNRGNKVEA